MASDLLIAFWLPHPHRVTRRHGPPPCDTEAWSDVPNMQQPGAAVNFTSDRSAAAIRARLCTRPLQFRPLSRLRHNLAVGFVFSLISIGNIKIVQAQQSTCSSSGSLPCMFGDCTFSKDANGMLTKTGTCSGSTGTLHLNSKGITALSADVFHQVGMT